MQIKVYVKRIFSILFCIMLLIIPQMQTLAAGSENNASNSELSGYILAAENEQLQLYYSLESARIKVRDQKNGYIWDSSLPEDKIPEGVTDLQYQEMTSLFNLTYSTANYFSSETSSNSLENKEYKVQAEDLENGFAYVIYIPDFDIQVRIEFVLNEYGLEVQIPEGGIVENIESGTLVNELCQELIELLEVRREKVVSIQEDDNIPNSLKKEINSAVKQLDEMIELLEETTEPFGISAVSTELQENLDEVFSLLIGTSSNKGFYTSLLASDKVDESVKTSYRQEMQLLQTEELNLKIKIAQLKEVPAITLVSISLLPYFGSTDDYDEGYMLYPDGCGALTYFKEEHGSFSSMYQADTYSSLSPDIDWEESKDSLGLSNVAIPYFGIKVGDNACIAYVSEGKAQSTISFSPSGYVIPVNRIGASFTYRQTVATSSVSGVWQSSEDVMVFEREMQQYEASLQYSFMEGEEADYSGMANALRSYMLDKGILTQSEISASEQMPIAMDLFGGYNDSILIFDKYVAGTTFEQARTILDSFDSIPVLCNYRGVFEEGFGVYPSDYKVSENLGDKKELNELASELKERGGQMFLESNQLLVDYDQSGYSDGDLAIGNRYLVIQNQSKTEFLFSPEKMIERYDESILPEMKYYESVGLSEMMMGSFVYADYSSKHLSTRTQTVEVYQSILQKMQEELGAAAVNSGSDYTFSKADWIRNVPDDISGYIYTDEAVPFYMMLVHGSVAYTSIPNNQFYNTREQMLEAIEYGMLPYYSLSYEDIDLASTGVYVSNFLSIYEDMVDTYNTYSEALGDLTGVPITNHVKEKDIAIVTYENGVQLIINYGDSKAEVNGITVDPMSFARSEKGEVTQIEEKEIKTTDEVESERVSVYSSLVVWLFVLLFVSIIVFGGVGFFYRHRS